MADKTRLDNFLAEQNMIETREKAKAYVLSGYVYVDGRKADKPALLVTEQSRIEIRHPESEFVSRGGYKLKKAMEEFALDVRGKTAVDIGASTGGFTDCLLQNGAAKVYAVDVGYGQLDWRIRNDARVMVMERQNARLIQKEQFADEIDFAVMDVSFISLKLILPAVLRIIRKEAEIIALIKPQFEAGRAQVGKKGVVRDAAVHLEVVRGIVSFAQSIGLYQKGLTFSPIQGPNGNIEYLSCFTQQENQKKDESIEKIVENAHHHFKNAKT
jgi:23S rRNA (cytidine1920-2'-O)/16S rRNA (cytidine1409-2'-O)-methyltransferase